MTEPASYEEYLQRLSANRGTSIGPDGAVTTLPCPFCAAPNFLTYGLLESEQALGQGATCSECGRSAKALFAATTGGTLIETVQTAGPDQPKWLVPPLRRIAETPS